MSRRKLKIEEHDSDEEYWDQMERRQAQDSEQKKKKSVRFSSLEEQEAERADLAEAENDAADDTADDTAADTTASTARPCCHIAAPGLYQSERTGRRRRAAEAGGFVGREYQSQRDDHHEFKERQIFQQSFSGLS